MAKSGSYHHGELRQALMSAALEVIARNGLTGLSLRQLAREAGVSHGAPAHHFGDRQGLITALATSGYRLLIGELLEALKKAPEDSIARLRATGIAYVRFAINNPAYFEVMFRPELHRESDPELKKSFAEARQILRDAVSNTVDSEKGARARDRRVDIATLRAWSIAHGLASLLLSGNLLPSGDHAQIVALATSIFSEDGIHQK